MFIREVTKKVKGKKYIQHQLIESIRTPAGPRQRMILNLGVLTLDKDKWKILANLIEKQLHNQEMLFKEDPQVEDLAKKYTQTIRKNKLISEAENTHDTKSSDEDFQEVDINSLCNSDSKSIGAEHVVFDQMKKYELDKTLKELKFEEKEIVYSKMLIAARIIHPDSERETARWINENSAMMEFFPKDIKVYDNALHRASLKLWENREYIEEKLAESARNIFSLKETIILYDLTNTYFSGSKKNSTIAKHGGKSKERRNDRPLVTLSLVVDDEGFPKSSKIYEGNISEPKTLGCVLDQLKSEKNIFSCEKTIVIDAGIASEENIQLIKDNGFKYVAVSRKRTYKEELWNNSEEKKIYLSDKKYTLKVKLSEPIDGEVFLHCHSEVKEKKESEIMKKKMKSFEDHLEHLHKKLKKKRTQKKYDKILEQVGRLKERYSVGSFYDITIRKEGQNAVELLFSKNVMGKKREEKIGNYVLRTNNIKLSEEKISEIHRSLTRIEDCFKEMKSIGLRPNYHRTDIATMAHIHVSVIGLHMLTGILKRLRSSEMHDKWKSIRNILETHRRETTTMNTSDKHVIDIRSCTMPTDKQSQIYRALDIKQTPLKKITIKRAIQRMGKTVKDVVMKMKR